MTIKLNDADVATLAAFGEFAGLRSSVASEAVDAAIGIMQGFGFDASVDEPDEQARAIIQSILELGFAAGSHFRTADLLDTRKGE